MLLKIWETPAGCPECEKDTDQEEWSHLQKKKIYLKWVWLTLKVFNDMKGQNLSSRIFNKSPAGGPEAEQILCLGTWRFGLEDIGVPGNGEPAHNCYGHYFLSKVMLPLFLMVVHDGVHLIWFQRLFWLKITLFCGSYLNCHPPKAMVHLATNYLLNRLK